MDGSIGYVRHGLNGMSDLIACWGEVLWDLYPDERRLGGAPANVAYHLAAIGRQTALISRVGDDELGADAVAALAEAGVDTAAIQIDAERETGVVGVSIDDGEASYTLHPGRAWERIALDESARLMLEDAAAICYGTLCLRAEEGRAQFRAAMESLPSSCMRICDPNFRPGHVDPAVVEAALTWADVVKINDDEARGIAQLFGASDPIRWLMNDLGITLLAVTRGRRGSALYRGDEHHDHPGVPRDDSGGDSVGCGDAYTAVLAALAVEQRPLAEINEAANRYASFVAAHRGATPTIPEELVREALG
jgi:fructokinase